MGKQAHINMKTTYVSKVIIVDRSALCSHSRCIFIGWANEEEITDSFANLVLILMNVVRMRPICILMDDVLFLPRLMANRREKKEPNVTEC